MELIAWTIVQDTAGRVLLGRRSGTRYADGLWNLPGGGVERGETLAEAAARETWEEVGLKVAPEALRPVALRPARRPGLRFLFPGAGLAGRASSTGQHLGGRLV